MPKRDPRRRHRLDQRQLPKRRRLLSFANTTNFTGSWDAATGILTLSGSDTLANYQAALRTVAYVNNRLNPSTATRTVSFKVNDGLADSNVLARDIAMQLLNPAVDDVVLGGPAASSLVNDYPANTIFSQFTFNGNCALSGNAAQLDSTIVNAQGANTLSLSLLFRSDALIEVSSGSLAVEGAIDTAGHLLTVETASATTATIDGSLTGSGSLAKSGAGTLVLAGHNGNAGNISVSGGLLKIAATDAVADGASLTVGSGAAALFNVNPAVVRQAVALSPFAPRKNAAFAERKATIGPATPLAAGAVGSAYNRPRIARRRTARPWRAPWWIVSRRGGALETL